jgi:hypothetical protein
MDRSLSIATQALQTATSVGFPITGSIVDKTTVGSFYVRVGVAIGTGATNIAVLLPRIPSMFYILDNRPGGVVYRSTADVAAATQALLVCRATVAGVYSLAIA